MSLQRTFKVEAIWDDEARVYVSQSDIIGLHIEAETIEEFEVIMRDVAAELVVANHMSAPDIASTPMRDLIPAIVWERPSTKREAA